MKRYAIGVVVLLLVALLVWIFSAGDDIVPSGTNGKTGNELESDYEKEKLVRGRELLKSEPTPVGSAEWLNWFNLLKQEDQFAYLAATDEILTPSEPSQAQKDTVVIKNWKPDDKSIFPAKALFNYKPLLRMDEGVPVYALQIETARGPNGLVSTIWARRAKNSIIIDWKNNSVIKGKVDNIKTIGGPSPQVVPAGMLLGAGNGKFYYNRGTDSFKAPWSRQSVVYPLALDENYRYAFGVERGDASKTIDSIVVVDATQNSIAGIIPVPEVKNGVHCIFEPKDNYLIVVDSSWQWILLFDLAKPTDK